MTTSPLPLEDRPSAQGRPSAFARVLKVAQSDARLAWLPLIAVVALSLALNAWRLNEVGLGNTYYAAAVRSMTMLWRNFFFGAFDPGGMITVDKPPVFLWVGALSVRVFGYSSWSILLPSAIAGAATVGLLWLIVRRTFGTFAATIAAVVLTLTPITVAVDRLNLPEPFFILALVAAAGAIVRSMEMEQPRGLRWAALAGVLVGIAFNTKMLAAWIPGPALALALIAGAGWPWRATWRPMLGRLVVLGVVTVVVSGSWMVVTDLTPASARPYVGGSTDNSVLNLVTGYNGFGRVDGGQGPGGARPGVTGRSPAATPGRGTQAATSTGILAGIGGFFSALFGSGTTTGGPGGFGGPGAANGPGGIIAGNPGPFRMIDAANGGQIGWFLAFALVSAALALWAWRADRLRRGAVVMWLGWVLLYAVVFSFARGIYHSYYTSALAPGIAALAGIGAVTAADLVRRDRRWLIAPVALAVVGLTLQFVLVGRVPVHYGWLRPWAVGVAVVGVLLMTLSTLRRVAPRISPRLGMAVVVAALLLIPAGWSVSEAANPSLNTTLPQAGPRGGAAGRTFGSQAFDQGTGALATWLRAHSTPGETWDLAVASAQNASTMIANDGLSVMAMGGFSGNDPAMTVARFADLVQQGRLRYVLAGGRGGFGGGGGGFGGPGGAPFGGTVPGIGPGAGGVGPGTPPGAVPGAAPRGGVPGAAVPGAGQFGGSRGRQNDGARPGGGAPVPGPGFAPPANGGVGGFAGPQGGTSSVMSAVQRSCTPVTDASLPAQYRGSLYDCSGKGAALAALPGTSTR